MPVEVSVEVGKICNKMTTGKRLERFGEICEVGIVEETNGFGLDFVEKKESGFWYATPEMGPVL